MHGLSSVTDRTGGLREKLGTFCDGNVSEASQSPVPIKAPLGIKELTAVLVKHYELHDGLYDLYLEYHFAAGNFGPSPAEMVPSTVVGISKLGLTKVSQLGPLTVDASQINPATVTPRKGTPRSKSRP